MGNKICFHGIEKVEGKKYLPGSPKPEKSLSELPSNKTRVRALYNFEPINEDDLSFKTGDLMEIDESTTETDDWWIATHLKTKKTGYIPRKYVIKDDASPQTQEWWFDVDREESDKMLLLPGNPNGTFLVRRINDMSSYVLSVRDIERATNEPCVGHYRIHKLDNDGGFFITTRKTFKTLIDLIDNYKETSEGLCCRLTKACPRKRPAIAFRKLEISREKVKLTNKLGAGFRVSVWEGTVGKGVKVAVKILELGTYKAFLDEAKIIHKLTHPKLVQLLAVVSVDQPFWVITELMTNGALLDYLRSDRGKKLSFNSLMDINSQIADGMSYLESKNFVHGDLRAANILVGDHLDIKVADLGFSRMRENSDLIENDCANENLLKWMATEAALEDRFSVKSDVWSYGVLLYEVITYGEVPYPGQNGLDVLVMVEKGKRMAKPTSGPIDVPDYYYDIMLKCWLQKPEERPTFEYLHNFF